MAQVVSVGSIRKSNPRRASRLSRKMPRHVFLRLEPVQRNKQRLSVLQISCYSICTVGVVLQSFGVIAARTLKLGIRSASAYEPRALRSPPGYPKLVMKAMGIGRASEITIMKTMLLDKMNPMPIVLG